MPNSFLSCLVCIAAISTPFYLIGQETSSSEFSPGISIGSELPSIKLPNQNGDEIEIEELLKSSHVALVFYRSADWWPFCKKHLVQLQKDEKKFKEAGIQLVGISYDSVAILKKFSDKSKLSFPLLSDQGSKIIKQLDIEDRRGLPHSGTILIDKENKVRGKIFYKGYAKRHPNQELLNLAKRSGLIE